MCVPKQVVRRPADQARESEKWKGCAEQHLPLVRYVILLKNIISYAGKPSLL
jgi:hypothetical protein